jgi:hypothetical protein
MKNLNELKDLAETITTEYYKQAILDAIANKANKQQK